MKADLEKSRVVYSPEEIEDIIKSVPKQVGGVLLSVVEHEKTQEIGLLLIPVFGRSENNLPIVGEGIVMSRKAVELVIQSLQTILHMDVITWEGEHPVIKDGGNLSGLFTPDKETKH